MRRMILSFYPATNPDDQAADRSIGWFVTTFTIVLIFILGAALIIALSNLKRGFDAPNFLTFLGLALLTGATGYAGGGLIGFLFGVPRVDATQGAQSGITSNTNLEQVSDWLTKIIVGVSLVEFAQINAALQGFRTEVDLAIGPHPNPAGVITGIGGAGFAACLILIGSAIAGFLAAYLKSKTDLMRAFAPRAEMESKL